MFGLGGYRDSVAISTRAPVSSTILITNGGREIFTKKTTTAYKSQQRAKTSSDARWVRIGRGIGVFLRICVPTRNGYSTKRRRVSISSRFLNL